MVTKKEDPKIPVSETKKDIVATDTGEVVGQEVGGNVFLTPQTTTQKKEEGVRTAAQPAGQPKITPTAEQTIAEIPVADPSLVQEQFEAEGGFQELEGRGERAIEGVAEAGLAVPVAIGNVIGEGISQIFGTEYTPGTAEELADTTMGKALGVGIVGTAAVGLIGGTIALAGSAISSAVGGLAISLGVSKGVVIAGGLFVAQQVSGLNPELMADKVLDRQNADAIQSGIGKIGTIASTIQGTYKAGGYGNNPAEALSQLNSLEKDLLIFEHKLQQAVILDPRIKQSGKYYDIAADIQDQRTSIDEARADVLISVPVFTPEAIGQHIQKFKDIMGEERKGLIEEGALKTSL